MTIAEEAMEHADKVLGETMEEMKKQNAELKGPLTVSFNSMTTYSGVRCMTFETAKQMEEELGRLPGHIIAWLGNDKFGNIVAIVSRELSDEEQEDLHEAGRILEERKAERQKLKAEALVKEAEAREKAEKEVNDLLALGRKARDHNIIEKNRELEKQVEELRREIKNLKRGKAK